MKTIIVKLGGSVITHKDRFPPQADLGHLRRLAREIKKAWEKCPMQLLVVHGAGCFGHIPAHRHRLTAPQWHEEKREGTVKIRQNMEKLNGVVVASLVQAGLPAMAFQPSSGALLQAKKLVQFPADVLSHWLERGVVPVTYGDVSADLETGIDILSGDQIVSYLADRLAPEFVVIGTDVDGVFSKDPQKFPDACLIPEIGRHNAADVLKGLGGSSHIDVTGGMAGKVRELLGLSEKGTRIKIVNARQETRMEKALSQEPCPGTVVEFGIE